MFVPWVGAVGMDDVAEVSGLQGGAHGGLSPEFGRLRGWPRVLGGVVRLAAGLPGTGGELEVLSGDVQGVGDTFEGFEGGLAVSVHVFADAAGGHGAAAGEVGGGELGRVFGEVVDSAEEASEVAVVAGGDDGGVVADFGGKVVRWLVAGSRWHGMLPSLHAHEPSTVADYW